MRHFVFLLVLGLSLNWPLHSAEAAPPTAAGLLNRMNQVRAAAQIPLVRDSYTLRRVAAARAADMVRFNYFNHVSAAGLTYQYWLAAGPARFQRTGENIARGYLTSLATTSGWLASGSHRSNLLNSRFTHAGTAVRPILYNGRPSYLYVTIFGRGSQ